MQNQKETIGRWMYECLTFGFFVIVALTVFFMQGIKELFLDIWSSIFEGGN